MTTLLLVALLICASIILLLSGADWQNIVHLVLDVGENNNAGSLPGAAGAGGTGWAACPDSPMGNLPPDQRQMEGDYCDNLRNTIQTALNDGGFGSPTVDRGWDQFSSDCAEKGWRWTPKSGTDTRDSFARPYEGQSLLDSCAGRFK